jgi:hypothetical protein
MNALLAPGETMQQKVGKRDATPDLLLKHPNTIVTTNVRRQLKHLEHAFETLEKTPEKHLKTIATIRKHPNKTHATYV